MDREGNLGRQSEMGAFTPKEDTRVWRGFRRWLKQTPDEVRIMGVDRDEWPAGTPQVYVDLLTKTTGGERSLSAIGLYPSVIEIQARSAEDVARIREEEARAVSILAGQVDELRRSLTLVERRVLQGRFGLDDGKSRTLAQMAVEIGRSPRTVGRIERRALDKLKHP